jgi:DNA mismatch repair ATPase MutS
VGKFFEFYYARDREIANCLGLSQMRKNPRGAIYGFPVNLIHRYIERLIKRKVSITLILERQRYWTGIKERIPAWRFETVVG